jgi:predicted dehydrogenase
MTDPTFKIGLVGTENSHATEIVRYLNDPAEDTPARVVALAGGMTEQNARIADLGSIGTVVENAAELVDAVDAMIITNRDGRLHRDLALPFLDRGIPVWVDKPLACSVEDARDILDAADHGGAVVTSYSALRWVLDADEVAGRLDQLGPLQTITITGPADAASPYAGIFFYGIHLTDLARRFAPGPVEPVTVRRVANTIIAGYPTEGPGVILQLVEPDDDRRVPFHLTAVGRHGIVSQEIRLGEGYVRPGVDAFLTMLTTREMPLTRQQMIDPIAVLGEIAAAI